MPIDTRRRTLHVTALAAALLALTAHTARAALSDDVSVGTGFAAEQICMRALLGEVNYLRVKWLYVAPDVSSLPLIWKTDYQPEGTPVPSITVSTWVPGYEYPSQVIYRAGLGCTVITPGSSVEGVLAQPFRPHVDRPVNTLPWPQGDGPAETSRLSTQQLAVVAKQGDALFAETTTALNKRQNTFAYLVVKDGHLVYERMRAGYDADAPQLGFSLTKTLTAMLAGMMERDGLLQLDASPPVPALTDGDKRLITWRHLLQMSSGLRWTESFTGYGNTSVMTSLQPDQAAYAAAMPLDYPPGQHFAYSSGSTNIATLGMRKVLGNDPQAFYDYYQDRLMAPLGMRRGVIQQDASGTANGGTRGALRPRDWLKLGQLIINQGRWNGQAIVPSEHIRFMTTPSPANPGFGAGPWLYGSLDMPADMPRDIVVLWGSRGQYVMLIPSKQLAVIRMGVSLDEPDTVQRMFQAMKELAAAL